MQSSLLDANKPIELCLEDVQVDCPSSSTVSDLTTKLLAIESQIKEFLSTYSDSITRIYVPDLSVVFGVFGQSRLLLRLVLRLLLKIKQLVRTRRVAVLLALQSNELREGLVLFYEFLHF